MTDEKEVEVLETIFGAATENPEFRNKMFSDPMAALSDYDISEAVKQIIADTIRRAGQQ